MPKAPHEKIIALEKLAIQEKQAEPFLNNFVKRLLYTVAKDTYSATDRDYYLSVAHTVKDHLVARWLKTQQEHYHQDAKRVYYLSMEFLTGRAMGNNLINLGLYEIAKKSLEEAGFDLEDLMECEPDAGLGNGGLGRLAACFMDSMATLQLPAYGYGIRYEFGIFEQQIRNGFQVEMPDNWLRSGNPWEIVRPEVIYPVHFYGEVHQQAQPDGSTLPKWVNTDSAIAMAYDMPIPAYGNNTVNTFRLWSAKSNRDFNLEDFNRGDYMLAVEHKSEAETITKVLYPEDSTTQGKELRLKQEYFFSSASLQDILRRYDKIHDSLEELPDKIAVQLNDTHPALSVVELMRIMVDERQVPWDKAWDITTRVFAYTNHTILPEALERWNVSLMQRVLPRHLQLISEINHRFLDYVWVRFPGDNDRLRRMSLLEEVEDSDEKKVRMGHLSVIGSHSVNGVSELHTQIIKDRIFHDFYELSPEKFNAKTNGITQRRWLLLANRRLSKLLIEQVGDDFVTDLYALKQLIPLADDNAFQKKWQDVKFQNKVDFATYVEQKLGEKINPESLFDFQVKRMHEYKRQLLNLMHVVHLYRTIRENPGADCVPRTVFFAGKAAPGYAMAKLIIKLISSVADQVNSDPLARGKLKVMFLPNYRVSLAQRIFPASELSEQISTSGTEASGTGNMKFTLNGALTIGTLDGANVEIREEVGEENFFLFGLKTHEVEELKANGYDPMSYYNADPDLKAVIDMIANGYFCREQRDLFRPITDSLLSQGDQYCLLADFDSYIKCQKRVSEIYQDQSTWTRMSILNVANTGKFSTDRTIKEYADDIWGVKPVTIEMDKPI